MQVLVLILDILQLLPLLVQLFQSCGTRLTSFLGYLQNVARNCSCLLVLGNPLLYLLLYIIFIVISHPET